MPLHEIPPYPKVLVYFIILEKVNLLQAMVHFLFSQPLLLAQKVGLLTNELGHSLAADGHVLVWVLFFEFNDVVVVWVGTLVKIKEVLAHVREVLEKLENCHRIHILLVLDYALPNERFPKLHDCFSRF